MVKAVNFLAQDISRGAEEKECSPSRSRVPGTAKPPQAVQVSSSTPQAFFILNTSTGSGKTLARGSSACSPLL